MKTSEREMTCKDHGITYMASVVTIRGKEIIQPCPECQKTITEENCSKESERESHKELVKKNGNLSCSRIPARYINRTIDNFVIENNGQQLAVDKVNNYLSEFCNSDIGGANLVLSGMPGTGKTHIACAVAVEFAQYGSVLFTTVSEMIRKIRSSYSKNSSETEQQIIDELSQVNMLVIDEVGIQKGSESEEHLLFEIINNRYSNLKSTILISNLNATEMEELIGARVFDRMREGGGSFIPFGWGSYRSNVKENDELTNKPEQINTFRPSKYLNHHTI